MQTDRCPFAMLASCGIVSTLTLTGLFALPTPQAGVHWQDALQGTVQTAYSAAFERALPFADFATSAVAMTRYAVFGQALDGALIGSDDWLFTAEDLAIGPDASSTLAENARYVGEVKAALAERGVSLIVAVIPDKSEIYADKLNRARPARVETRRAEFTAALAEHGVEVTDLGPVLAQARTTGDVFVKDDTHWSPFGADRSAQAIAMHPSLAAQDLTSAHSETQRLGMVAHDGDLLSFIPTGTLRAYGGPPQFMIEQVVTQTDAGGGLFGDAAPEVALIGTSYSAMPEWNFAGFLETALQAQVLNLAVPGQGPFSPMQDFLATPDANDPNLKAVIWEIPARYTSQEFSQ